MRGDHGGFKLNPARIELTAAAGCGYGTHQEEEGLVFELVAGPARSRYAGAGSASPDGRLAPVARGVVRGLPLGRRKIGGWVSGGWNITF